jgi:hypothetical protein
MRSVPTLMVGFLLLLPTLALGQGIPMSPDFLPLEIGNLWTYEIEDATGRRTRFEMEILDHRIVDGLSLYVFSRLPFAPGATFDDPIGVHFDQQARQYIYTDGVEQGALFPARGQRAEVVETDEAGLPFKVELDYTDRSLSLERGLGITGGSLMSAGGRRSVTLVGARVGVETVGDTSRPGLPPLDVEAPVDNVVLPSEVAPVLELEAIGEGSGHRFVLHVQNPTDKLMPFEFTTSQDFDVVVTEAETGREVWRWATRMFFSEVLRTESIRAAGEWTFEAEWNHTDSDLNAVEPGTYRAHGVLVAETPYESAAVEIQVD